MTGSKENPDRPRPTAGPAPLWQEAASFAARAHQNQNRKDGRTPYVAHVFRVTLTVSSLFGCTDQTVLAAALLHDTIEDTTTDYDDLAERFGTDVADCVAALTKNATLPEQEREAEYDERLAKAGWRAKLIKLADTYDNLMDARASGHDRARLDKHLEKCRRALHLARADGASNSELKIAISFVSARVEEFEPGSFPS